MSSSASMAPLAHKDYEWLRWALDAAIQQGQSDEIRTTLVALHQKLTTLQAEADGLTRKDDARRGLSNLDDGQIAELVRHFERVKPLTEGERRRAQAELRKAASHFRLTGGLAR